MNPAHEGARIDWPGLIRLGIGPRLAGGLGLLPADFWRLSPAELRIMAGIGERDGILGRARLEALMAAFPDRPGGGANGGN